MKKIEFDEDHCKQLLEKILQKIPTKDEPRLTDKEIKALKNDVKDLALILRGDVRDPKEVKPEEVKNWNLSVLEDSLPEWKLRDLDLLQRTLEF